MKVSVIIPIYNVEPYIERCARSLMEQTLDDVEFIFVDDCSPDGSIGVLRRVLAEYPSRHVTVLTHEKNRGLPAARNTGLAHATGEYVFHCDSDDYMEPGALFSMYQTAQANDADIVYSDWYLSFPNKERYMRQPVVITPAEALHEMLHGGMKWNVWNKLVRRELYNANYRFRPEGIWFPEGHGMGEDMTMLLLTASARRIIHVPMAAYHYVRQNEHAFTAQPSAESYEALKHNADRVIAALQDKVSEEDLACFKLNVKFPFLISAHRDDYERWNLWFPEANSHIATHNVSRRSRFLEKAAARKQYWLLRIYYCCVYKLVYGLIY